ncbi:PDZ domain-containing protein [Thermoactinomyces sp. DSM 45891]|uniref:SepM family pheromone-processing serine protease n=1 Tax=Thermoactinomyces sp. DSM 45891 TaxID=1761907 RepID=UPI00090EE2AC|nr:SepM family pheromone-processing serine protease [Thermoactinomyces sp. DSM 45891]SFX05743.1 PDZ domain-containing protein [Thermoactinomyces sp. DSM 45891]
MVKRNNKGRVFFGILAFLILIGILGTPIAGLPYYVMEPGSAEDVAPFVKVDEKPTEHGKGTFYLTTVGVGKATVLDWIWAQYSHELELIPEKEMFVNVRDDEEYQRQQKENMLESQNAALIAAFREAKKPMKVDYLGVEVFSIRKDNGLQVGDLITAIDGQPILRKEELFAYLEKKKIGDRVKVKFQRTNAKDPIEKEIVLTDVAQPQEGQERAGLGIYPLTREKVNTTPSVKIEAGEIGGPSAGLMFTLEMYDQLTEGDLTHSMKIAGTGTMNSEGKVGQIGGIQYKVRAADKEGAEIFFAPKDIQSTDENEKVAIQAAKEIKTKMKIVPVATFQEALQYLQSQEKSFQKAS